MKGAIKEDHIPTNNYELLISGLPPITVTTLSGIEDELQTVDLPDRTKASGGNRGSTEFTIGVPMHHTTEQAALEIMYKEAQDPVSPTYKKGGTLVHKSISGATLRTFTLFGAFITKRALPDLEMSAEGEQAIVEWTFSVDDILPI